MIPTVFLAFVLLQGSISISGPKSGTRNSNEFVQCRTSITTDTIGSGAAAELRFVLTPKKGIHINLRPAMSIVVDSAFASPGGSLSSTKDTTTGYLDCTKPVRQALLFNPELTPGIHRLKGVFTYYYCSDAEGWCSRFKQPIDLAFTVTK